LLFHVRRDGDGSHFSAICAGSSDGTVRVWEVETGRCLRRWEVGEAVSCVSWNPLPDMHILAVSA